MPCREDGTAADGPEQRSQWWWVADGRLTRIRSDFTLEGSNVSSKLFAAFCNWIGHILFRLRGSQRHHQRHQRKGLRSTDPLLRAVAVRECRQLRGGKADAGRTLPVAGREIVAIPSYRYYGVCAEG